MLLLLSFISFKISSAESGDRKLTKADPETGGGGGTIFYFAFFCFGEREGDAIDNDGCLQGSDELAQLVLHLGGAFFGVVGNVGKVQGGELFVGVGIWGIWVR